MFKMLGNVDLDTMFAYPTFKMVRIRDRRLGFLFLWFLLLSFLSLTYQLICTRGFATRTIIDGTPYVHLENPGSNPARRGDKTFKWPDYCGNCSTDPFNPPCNCVVYDSTDIGGSQDTITEIFVPFSIQFVNQTRAPVAEFSDPTKNTVTPWDTWKNETPSASSEWRTMRIPRPELMTVVVTHSGLISDNHKTIFFMPEHLFGEVISDRNDLPVKGMVFPGKGDGNNTNRFTLMELMRHASKFDLPKDFPGAKYKNLTTYIDYCTKKGCKLRISIDYGNCLLMRGFMGIFSNPKIKIPLTNKQYNSTCSGSLTKTDYYMITAQLQDMSGEIRRVISRQRHRRSTMRERGVLVVVSISGEDLFPTAYALMTSILVAVLLVMFATVFVDIIALTSMGMRKHYREAKFQTTKNFKDIRQNQVDGKKMETERMRPFTRAAMLSLTANLETSDSSQQELTERTPLVDVEY